MSSSKNWHRILHIFYQNSLTGFEYAILQILNSVQKRRAAPNKQLQGENVICLAELRNCMALFNFLKDALNEDKNMNFRISYIGSDMCLAGGLLSDVVRWMDGCTGGWLGVEPCCSPPTLSCVVFHSGQRRAAAPVSVLRPARRDIRFFFFARLA